MKFSASLDNLAKGITLAMNILFIFIATFPYLFLQASERGNEVIIIPIWLFIIDLVIFIFRPISYSITDQEVIIHRLWKDVKISRTAIQSVELLDENFSKNTLRTFGVGGVWGYWGKFSHSSLGNMTWYVTRRDKMVLLKITDNKKIVLSPDRLEEFVEKMM